MNLFKSYTYSWWQIGIFKLSLICIGVLIGSYFKEVLAPYLPLVLLVAIATALYMIGISLKQL